MVKAAQRVLGGLLVLTVAACTRQVDGVAALPYTETPGPEVILAVDADDVMIDLPGMRGITGGGDQLHVIPSMDSTTPTDIDLLAKDAPASCRFLFAETTTFGADVADFHKITYQDLSVGGQISQGAAVYRAPADARHALTSLSALAQDCAQTSFGQIFVGTVTGDAESMRIRPGGDCGRDYRLKSAVLAEVTFCAFGDSVPEIVMTNLMNKVPG
ncbi:MAG: sensor domain-containing protein [Mycobacterium sp.]|nr:sensor domain-containing protein [Mycobacterium sp.]